MTTMNEKLQRMAVRAVANGGNTFNVPFVGTKMDVVVEANRIEIRVHSFTYSHPANADFGIVELKMPHCYWYKPEAEKRALRRALESDEYAQANVKDIRTAFTFAHYLFEAKYGRIFN